jgi:quercetin dioxygenase-like cupin family protein
MKQINFKSAEPSKKGKGFTGKQFTSDSKTEVVQLEFEPGAGLPAHKTPVDVIFYCISGKGVITIEDTEYPLKEGGMLDSPAEIPHAVENRGDNNFLLLVIKLFR